MSRSKQVVAFLSLGALLVSQGCAGRLYPRPTVLPDGSDIRITAGMRPLVVYFDAGSGLARSTPCFATMIGGYSTGRAGDTIRILSVAAFTPVDGTDSACAPDPSARVLVDPTAVIRPYNDISGRQVAIVTTVGLVAVYLLARYAIVKIRE